MPAGSRHTPSLTMSDGAKISVTRRRGTAGDIALNLSSLALTGGARIDSDTAGGARGNVTIAARLVNISGATVSRMRRQREGGTSRSIRADAVDEPGDAVGDELGTGMRAKSRDTPSWR